jgi:hypothetical protein
MSSALNVAACSTAIKDNSALQMLSCSIAQRRLEAASMHVLLLLQVLLV